jgi:DNA-binding HxlR family transcriptional regulator
MEACACWSNTFWPARTARAEYVLTAMGRDLGPIVAAMRNWGRKYPR